MIERMEQVKTIVRRVRPFVSEHRFLLALIFMQAISFHAWLFQNAIFTFGDVGVLNPETLQGLFQNALTVYFPDSNFGTMNVAASSNPFVFLFGLLGFFGISGAVAMKILVLYPVVFGTVISSYLLVLKITGSKKGAFFGALLYSYNTYFLITLTGALYISLAYAFSPFILLAFISLIERPSARKGISLALLLAIVGYVEFRVLYINVCILAIYFLVRWLVERWDWPFLRKLLLPLSISGALLILFNLFWILPLAFSGSIAENALFSRGLFGSSYFDLLNAFSLFHPWWTGQVPSIFIKQQAPAYFLAFPLIFFAVFFWFRSHRKVLPFLILFSIGVLLTKQASAPFEDLYLWLYRHIPGFNAFRESSKFFLVTSLAASVLVGFFFAMRKEGPLQRRLFLVAEFFLVAFFLVQIYTVSIGKLETLFIPREFPEEYAALNRFLKNQDGYGRILWVPHTNRFGSYSNERPAVSLLTNSEGLFHEFVDLNAEELEDGLASILEEEGFYEYISENSVRYIVVPSDLVWDDVASPWKDPALYLPNLDKVGSLKKLEEWPFQESGITIYENMEAKPHIFLSRSPLRDGSSRIIPEVTRVSPTQFQIRVPKQEDGGGLYLHFSEAYHPGWTLQEGEFRYREALFGGNKGPMIAAEEGAYDTNVFLVPDEGAESGLFSLYFAPQKHYLFGGILGLLAFLGSLAFLIYDKMAHKAKIKP